MEKITVTQVWCFWVSPCEFIYSFICNNIFYLCLFQLAGKVVKMESGFLAVATRPCDQWTALLAVLLADRRAGAESVRGAEAEDQPGQSCLLQ